MINNIEQLADHLSSLTCRKRIAVVCGNDDSSLSAVRKAIDTDTGFANATFVGHVTDIRRKLCETSASPPQTDFIETDNDAEAARIAVELVRKGEADILMKGLIGTDVLLRAILDKQNGLLPPHAVLTHIAIADWKAYGKLLLFTDAAVIPYPTPEQRRAQMTYVAKTCRALGIEVPRVALVHCSEKANEKFPHTIDYKAIAAEARQGCWGQLIADGPLDTRTACDKEALRVKGINSPLKGYADALIFPDIESANTFYKTITFFAGIPTAGILAGTACPVVLPSRGDSAETKIRSLALAAL